MRLYQYWDTGAPPDAIAEGVDSFRDRNRGMKHRLYDRDAAAWFIGKRLGQRERQAFEACAVPAMQADYFRLCALWATGGVYADCDQTCGEPIQSLLARFQSPLVPTRKGLVTQHFMIFPRPGDSFLRTFLDLTILNIEARDIPNVHTATGPGAMRALWTQLDPATAAANRAEMTSPQKAGWGYEQVLDRARSHCDLGPDVVRAFGAIATIDRVEAFPWFAPIPADYKATAVHWMHWPGSIYADAAASGPGGAA